MATVPTVNVTFKQLATTLLERSERGIAILCLDDNTLSRDCYFEWEKSPNSLNTLGASITGNTFSISDSEWEIDNLKTGYAETCYAGYKMDSAFKMTFTTAISGTLRLCTANVTSGDTITIDGTEFVLSSGDTYTDFDLAAGKHTITKGTTAEAVYLLYVGVETEGMDDDTFITQTYKSISDVLTNIYTDKNITYIKQCLNYAPYELIVVSGSPGDGNTISAITAAIMKATSTGWIACPEASIQSDLASWIKTMEEQDYTYKGIGTVSGKDCKQYVYFNQSVYDTDGNVMKAVEYLPSLLGIIASCNVNGGVTNFLCTDLSDVVEVDDVQAAMDEGRLVLKNDIGGVRIVAGINSLVTLNGSTATEDMQYIETVEAMNLIKDDIREEFKTTYLGKFKNKYSNQMLFIGAVNTYFEDLENEDILDSEFDNVAEIDVDAQRSAWVGSGKSEAEDWDDDYVKSMSYKRTVFVKANIKILNCMENLEFTVTME